MLKTTYISSLNISAANSESHTRVCDLKEILDWGVKNLKGVAKGNLPAIFPVESNKRPIATDVLKGTGVLFCDLDNIYEHTDNILAHSNDLFQAFPNLYCLAVSSSNNIHAFVYDEEVNVENAKDIYKDKSRFALATLSQVILNATGVDCRLLGTSDHPCLDKHSCNITQAFFICSNQVIYNPFFVPAPFTLKPAQKKQLIEEYPRIWGNDLTPIIRDEVSIKSAIPTSDDDLINTGDKILVDHNYTLCNLSGYELRTAIAATAYVHFDKDIETTKKYIKNFYVIEKDKDIVKQMVSMARNNSYVGKYNAEIEKILFRTKSNILQANQYISDIFNPDDYKEQFIYLIANPGTGKTEAAKRYLEQNENTVVVEMNLALKEGKCNGLSGNVAVPQYNKAKINNNNRVFGTIDNFVNNSYKFNLEETTVFVDETHLLQSYIDLGGRYDVIKQFLALLPKCKKVIFMSATPEKDIELFDFRQIRFVKQQPQHVIFHMCPVKYTGSGSKLNGMYSYISARHKKMPDPTLYFSDMHWKEYEKYGFKNEEVTYFKSDNIKHPYMQSILKNNRLSTHNVVATCYLGVGVEIKGYDKINIVMNLNEGFSLNYIEQCIGRPRDAKEIHVWLYYTSNKLKSTPLKAEDYDYIENCFENYIIVDEEGTPHINILASKHINLYDRNFGSIDKQVSKQIQLLKVGHKTSRLSGISAENSDAFKILLNFKKIDIIDEPLATININGLEAKHRDEVFLMHNLETIPQDMLAIMFNFQDNKIKNKELEESQMGGEDFPTERPAIQCESYDEVIKLIGAPINNRKDAIDVLKITNRINNLGLSVIESFNYFGYNISAIETIFDYLRSYRKLKSGEDRMKYFEGCKKDFDKVNKEIETVEKIFNIDWLERKIGADDNEIELPSLIDEEKGLERYHNPFIGKSYKERMREHTGRKATAISIMNIKTGEQFDFDSKDECMKFLGAGSNVFSKFVKGIKTKLDKQWKIL